jgi:SAM-dependent methyltransferase
MLDALVQSLARRLGCFSKQRSRKNLYAWLREVVDEYGMANLGRVVNIGAGGEVANLLDQAGVKPLSIDIDQARNPDLVADVGDLSALGDSTVDGVICIEVLEHVKHPHLAVRELHRVLKPGGVIVGSTPFLLGIHDQPADYFRYTRFGLQLLFTSFEAVVLRERNGYFAATAVLVLRRFVIGTPREKTLALWLSPILISLVYIFEILNRVLPTTDGTTGYFFVFRKPVGKSEYDHTAVDKDAQG